MHKWERWGRERDDESSTERCGERGGRERERERERGGREKERERVRE